MNEVRAMITPGIQNRDIGVDELKLFDLESGLVYTLEVPHSPEDRTVMMMIGHVRDNGMIGRRIEGRAAWIAFADLIHYVPIRHRLEVQTMIKDADTILQSQEEEEIPEDVPTCEHIRFDAEGREYTCGSEDVFAIFDKGDPHSRYICEVCSKKGKYHYSRLSPIEEES